MDEVKMTNKPRIFIGSSSDSLDIANACNVGLDHTAEVSVWPNVFDKAGSDTLSSLMTKADNVDFALFVFSPDDVTSIRGNNHPTVRDNVLFELGLFIGSLGKNRCFILKPRNAELYIASDLAGINTLDFDSNRSDTNLDCAVNAACVKITTQMNQQGRYNKNVSIDKVMSPKISKDEYSINDKSLRLLAELLSTHTTSVNGMFFWDIEQKALPFSEAQLQIALIKLTRIGYINRTVTEDYNGNSGYGFFITNSGVEYLLENEKRLDSVITAEENAKQNFQQPQQQYKGYRP
jgi:DNA-binding PadR family transcriptional regulator